ncbi:hypothetical protein PRIPAC_97432 [Pristionchus pacificus]|uniref:DOT1 domain-containing protein n=1 Tax=Pristionchus pacificus TaxID=54126 RepID=A0A2A6BC85_PRIPA|nr:hypothetical protein PRIPAC_97432 [Pristionchus pacificus]|eukprot:PDM63476.1 hypothetical protein PRIPAC_53833 [Pristionchus pacificus]
MVLYLREHQSHPTNNTTMAARSSKKKVKRAQAYRRSGKASNRSKNVPMNSLDELLNERKKRRPSRARPNSHSASRPKTSNGNGKKVANKNKENEEKMPTFWAIPDFNAASTKGRVKEINAVVTEAYEIFVETRAHAKWLNKGEDEKTYGETNPNQIRQYAKKLGVTKGDAEEIVGIEIDFELAMLAQNIGRVCQLLFESRGIRYARFRIIHGSFLDENVKEEVRKCDNAIVFANNYVFKENTNVGIIDLIKECQNGTQLCVTKSLDGNRYAKKTVESSDDLDEIKLETILPQSIVEEENEDNEDIEIIPKEKQRQVLRMKQLAAAHYEKHNVFDIYVDVTEVDKIVDGFSWSHYASGVECLIYTRNTDKEDTVRGVWAKRKEVEKAKMICAAEKREERASRKRNNKGQLIEIHKKRDSPTLSAFSSCSTIPHESTPSSFDGEILRQGTSTPSSASIDDERMEIDDNEYSEFYSALFVSPDVERDSILNGHSIVSNASIPSTSSSMFNSPSEHVDMADVQVERSVSSLSVSVISSITDSSLISSCLYSPTNSHEGTKQMRRSRDHVSRARLLPLLLNLRGTSSRSSSPIVLSRKRSAAGKRAPEEIKRARFDTSTTTSTLSASSSRSDSEELNQKFCEFNATTVEGSDDLPKKPDVMTNAPSLEAIYVKKIKEIEDRIAEIENRQNELPNSTHLSNEYRNDCLQFIKRFCTHRLVKLRKMTLKFDKGLERNTISEKQAENMLAKIKCDSCWKDHSYFVRTVSIDVEAVIITVLYGMLSNQMAIPKAVLVGPHFIQSGLLPSANQPNRVVYPCTSQLFIFIPTIGVAIEGYRKKNENRIFDSYRAFILRSIRSKFSDPSSTDFSKRTIIISVQRLIRTLLNQPCFTGKRRCLFSNFTCWTTRQYQHGERML